MAKLPPVRTVTTRDGTRWTVRARSAAPPWDRGELGSYDETDPFELPLLALDAVWSLFLRPVLRLVFVVPVAALRARRTRAVRVEARCGEPRPRVLVWMTTRGLVAGVMDDVAAGLAAGRVVEPEGAVFAGER